jgi:5'-3' exonuclease
MMQTQAWKKITVEMNVDLIRHLVLNALLQAVKNHRTQYGQCIIACDNGSSWRKHVFAPYKGLRGLTKDKYAIDWGKYYTFLNEVIEDLKTEFPYTVVSVPHAEGDDVIGVLVNKFGSDDPNADPVLIISEDKDFLQLMVHDNVSIYRPFSRTLVVPGDRHSNSLLAFQQ